MPNQNQDTQPNEPRRQEKAEDVTVEQFAKTLKGVNPNKIKEDLLNLGYLRRVKAGYRDYAQFRHLFVRKPLGEGVKQGMFVTEEGKKLLKQLHKEKKLTRKLTK